MAQARAVYYFAKPPESFGFAGAGKHSALFDLRDAFYVGTSEIFGNGMLRVLARSLKLIPVDPDANLVPAMRAGFFEAWPRGKGFQKFSRLQIAFGDPIYPPVSVENPEVAYERLTAELKSRIMEMWLGLREPAGRRQAAAIRAT